MDILPVPFHFEKLDVLYLSSDFGLLCLALLFIRMLMRVSLVLFSIVKVYLADLLSWGSFSSSEGFRFLRYGPNGPIDCSTEVYWLNEMWI